MIKTVYEISKEGRRAWQVPEGSVARYELSASFLATEQLNLPEADEVSLVRHYLELSDMCHGVDHGFVPVGGETMKYNPKINEFTSSYSGFTGLHPSQKKRDMQGSIELIYRLQEAINAITGMAGTSVQPSNADQSVFTALSVVRKYFMANGEDRNKVLICKNTLTDLPGGYLPATMQMVAVECNEQGFVDVEDLYQKLDSTVACVILTNPNMFGRFDARIAQITQKIKENGSLSVYYAENYNALMCISNPAIMGFDVACLDLVKIFAIPHAGGGPGANPVAVSEELVAFLPSPVVTKDRSGTYSLSNMEKTIGSVKSYYGNFSMLVKAYTYVTVVGKDGLRNAAEMAVLNANYFKKLLEKHDENKKDKFLACFAFSLNELFEKTGIGAEAVADATVECGVNSPAVCDCQFAQNTLLFEPAENESKETIEEYAQLFNAILDKANERKKR